MIINALNSGARVFMADFEDATSPRWINVLSGQRNLKDAVRRTLIHEDERGRRYEVRDEGATLVVRPRGLHLTESHILVDGAQVSASLFDFGLYLFHNYQALLERGTGPYFYLPKLESHLEARLWNEAFRMAEDMLRIPWGTIRATVLIETIPAAFEMDEMLFSLQEHASGLNAGRWDYVFSIIKKFRDSADFVLPDRSLITMTVPFMRSYTELLVKTCHRRAAHAIGGMAAFVPSRRDPEANREALSKVRDDKLRESQDGFDGTWVAHPDLVPVARDVFDSVLDGRPNQIDREPNDAQIEPADLLDIRVPGGTVTSEGLASNIRVALWYLECWLRGIGAVAIDNLMEDTATAEIARSQVWQWIHQGVNLEDGRRITPTLVHEFKSTALEQLRDEIGAPALAQGKFREAAELFDRVALREPFVEFLTLEGYNQLAD